MSRRSIVHEGEPEQGDAYRVSNDEPEGLLIIDSHDVLTDLRDAANSEYLPGLIVQVDGKVFAKGDASLDFGWGYSDYTPMYPDRILLWVDPDETSNRVDVLEQIMDAIAKRERVRIEWSWDDIEGAVTG